ncbi:MAG: hypothetical protein IPJ77_15950 [Planctomycetes bacterium]|nr:hypothetical protein [Planctomycetota bacterium]
MLLPALLGGLALAPFTAALQRGAPKPEPPASPAEAVPGAQGDDAPRAAGDAAPDRAPRPLPTADEWKELQARDRRVAFTPRTAADARALLASSAPSAEKRAAAWLALGSSGAVSERLALEDLTRHGAGIERRAAILALGELSTGVEALFTSLTSEEDEIAECALLALLRSNRAASRRRVEEIANDPGHPLHDAAGALLVFVADRAGSTPNRASALLLELRWQAARQFGLVDGQAWQVLQVQRLAYDPVFRRELVVRRAARLYRPGARDHLLQILLAGQGPARITTAIAAMPLEVQSLVENDLWAPADHAEWRLVLEAIDARGLASVVPGLLERAAAVDALHYEATVLLARTGKIELARYVDPDLSRLGIADRLAACDAFAISGDLGWRSRLEDLEQSLDVPVRLAARVARMRLGSRVAEDEVRGILGDVEHADHAALVRVLLGVARDPVVGNLLEDYLPTAEGAEALDLAVTLCQQGRITARARVRAALAADPTPKGPEALRLLRALGRRPGPEDLELLRQLFPLEDERDVQIELAGALLELGDPEILPVVRASLWQDEFDLSLLAAAVLAEVGGGVRVLRDELRVPPAEAASADLRRVGFAIGAWGGMREVEDLARELRYASGHPALQGALLGVLSTRTQ